MRPKNVEKDKSGVKNSDVPTKKATSKERWIIALGILGAITVILIAAMSSSPVSTTPASGSPTASDLMGLLFITGAGIVWLLKKIWPFLCFGLLWWAVFSSLKDAVRDGIQEALRDYFVKKDLKETIKEAVGEGVAVENLTEIQSKIENLTDALTETNEYMSEIKDKISP